jgi:hypothetical protein
MAQWRGRNGAGAMCAIAPLTLTGALPRNVPNGLVELLNPDFRVPNVLAHFFSFCTCASEELLYRALEDHPVILSKGACLMLLNDLQS